MRAKDVLLDAIRSFSGTVLFVSHDRYFIDGLATRVFEVEDRRVHIYPGNYEDYLWRKQGGPEKVAAQLAPTPAPISIPIPAPSPAAPKPAVKKLNPIKLKLLEDQVGEIEEQIADLESQISAAESRLGIFTTAEEAQKGSAELDRMRHQHTSLSAQWEQLGTELELQRD
jgi:ATP-binding cassette subfamily F protein 3